MCREVNTAIWEALLGAEVEIHLIEAHINSVI